MELKHYGEPKYKWGMTNDGKDVDLYVGAQFTKEELALYADYEITGVNLYLTDDVKELKVVLCSADKKILASKTAASIKTGEMFSVAFDEPVAVPVGSSIYVGYFALFADGKEPIAADAGPRVTTLRITVTLLLPFMPDSCAKAFTQIGAAAEQTTWDNAAVWGVLPADVTVQKGETLFPRIDMAKELAELEALKAAKKAAAAPKSAPVLPDVTIDEFAKCDMRVCKVLKCEPVKKSDKLLCFTLNDGSGTDRQILSGIAKYYRPEELVGKTVVAILNLPPRKMVGQEYNGMPLSAEKDEKLNLLMLDDKIPAGAKMC